MKSLLVRSGATLSTVTSKLPRITGNLAIFSGLREEREHRGGKINKCERLTETERGYSVSKISTPLTEERKTKQFSSELSVQHNSAGHANSKHLKHYKSVIIGVYDCRTDFLKSASSLNMSSLESLLLSCR